ncbi:family 43 glycosylhydrolase [Nannocystis radixulma]|uniref:Family 43 glycosylhydrolase n=1 Tax=Nannocystis radixulma TaxID=2995305 RepID=A0ABT5AYR9_9BACT|nr:family 43 glycosylhydrolase [Nannocystis radixulma]MDC0666368.1 family 43 glycosylhydrolase [Nannocystis radixulma]
MRLRFAPLACTLVSAACFDDGGIIAGPTGDPGTGSPGEATGGSTGGPSTSTSPPTSTGDTTGSTGDEPGCPDVTSPECPCPSGQVLKDSVCVPETCAADTCHGHGVCADGLDGVTCACDEGFTGGRCDGRGADFYSRTLLMPGLADPDIYKEHDDLFLLTGTGSSLTLPIYESTDLLEFHEKKIYDPTALDPAHDYCYIWAPDLTRHDGAYHLYFSAHRVASGAPCPPGAAQDVATFHTSAPTLDLEFGIPELIHDGTPWPRTRIASGCPPEGCSRAIRIDAAAFDDGAERWLFYVWFQGGNNISSFPFSNPDAVTHHAGPALFAVQPFEEQINEAPDVFARAGKHYLSFSTGFFNSQYAMFHVVSDAVGDLTRSRAVRRHSVPIRSSADILVETHGHNSIVERRGEVFNVFHVGSFDGGGNLTDRSTHKQRIAFKPDGSIHGLNFVDLRWPGLPGHEYSLDVVTRDGTVHGPCIADGLLGSATSVRYAGICPSAGDVRVAKSDVAAFRLYYSDDGTWQGPVERPYDGFSDQLFLPIPGGTAAAVELHWNEKVTGTEYSLDVRRTDDTWVAPCAGELVLGTDISYVFTGACPTAGNNVPLQDVKELRICSAVGNDWANPSCASVSYDGVQGFVDVSIP